MYTHIYNLFDLGFNRCVSKFYYSFLLDIATLLFYNYIPFYLTNSIQIILKRKHNIVVKAYAIFYNYTDNINNKNRKKEGRTHQHAMTC